MAKIGSNLVSFALLDTLNAVQKKKCHHYITFDSKQLLMQMKDRSIQLSEAVK